MSELVEISRQFERAKGPEDLFGKLSGSQRQMLAQATRTYRHLAKITHPDKHTGKEKAIAEAVFKKLGDFFLLAKKKISAGVYGTDKSVDPITIRGRKGEYTLRDRISEGDVSDNYVCDVNRAESSGIIKICREASDNQFLVNEARVLADLAKKVEPQNFKGYFPELIETFSIKDGSVIRVANVFSFVSGLHSLEEVRKAYPRGVDPKDAAWIWRRNLFVLGNTHSVGYIHAANTPNRVFIHPKHHGLVLVDWEYSVKEGEGLKAISSDFEQWYPPEIFTKGRATFGLDIYLAAKCVIYILGGDTNTLTMPDNVPQKLQAFLRGTALANPAIRPQDAFALLSEFDTLIVALWGPRRFHEFTMPSKTT